MYNNVFNAILAGLHLRGMITARFATTMVQRTKFYLIAKLENAVETAQFSEMVSACLVIPEC